MMFAVSMSQCSNVNIQCYVVLKKSKILLSLFKKEIVMVSIFPTTR